MPWMRKKTPDARFAATYQALALLQPVKKIEPAVVVELMQLRAKVLDANGDLARLDKAMSLGFRWELVKSATETQRRHHIRGVLLGYATLGDPDKNHKPLPIGDVEKRKGATEKLTAPQLQSILSRMFDHAVESGAKHQFIGCDTSLERENAVHAVERVAEAVTRVQLALSRVNSDPKEKKRFEIWFGATSNPKLIKTNFDKIYWGMSRGIIFVKDPDPAEATTYAYVRPGEEPVRLYLCGSFWKHTKVTWVKGGGALIRKDGRASSDNPLGVLLHEFSHLFAETDDVAYGQADCKRLAVDHPGEAVINADNHEYYAESIMKGM